MKAISSKLENSGFGKTLKESATKMADNIGNKKKGASEDSFSNVSGNTSDSSFFNLDQYLIGNEDLINKLKIMRDYDKDTYKNIVTYVQSDIGKNNTKDPKESVKAAISSETTKYMNSEEENIKKKILLKIYNNEIKKPSLFFDDFSKMLDDNIFFNNKELNERISNKILLRLENIFEVLLKQYNNLPIMGGSVIVAGNPTDPLKENTVENQKKR